MAYLKRIAAEPVIYDPEFGSMPLNPGAYLLDEMAGLPWQRPPRPPSRGDRLARVWAARAGGTR